MRVIMSRRVRGFTLVEMLVVLMVIGLFIGLVSAITSPDDRGLLRLEAERLAQLLDLAASEARLTGRRVAWTADGPGYRFWRAGDDDAWSEVDEGELLRARILPQGMTLSEFRVENAPPQGAMRLEFSPQGWLVAFTIGMSLGRERYAILGSPIGEVRVLPGEGKANGDVALQ